LFLLGRLLFSNSLEKFRNLHIAMAPLLTGICHFRIVIRGIILYKYVSSLQLREISAFTSIYAIIVPERSDIFIIATIESNFCEFFIFIHK
jgi:hypothetical protein